MTKPCSKPVAASVFQPRITAGQTLCWAWMFTLSHGLNTPQNTMAPLDYLGPGNFSTETTVLCIALLALGVWFWRPVSQWFAKPPLKLCIIACLTLSAVLVGLPALVQDPSWHAAPVLATVGSVVMNLAVIVQGIGVSHVISKLDWRTVLYVSALPLIFGAGVSLVLVHVPVVPLFIASLAMPTVFTLLVCPGTRPFASARDERDRPGSPAVPRRYCYTAVAHGIAAGVAFSLVIPIVGIDLAGPWGIASPMLGAFMVITAVIACKLDYNNLLYRYGMPLLALGFLGLALLPQHPYWGGVTYLSLHYFINTVMNCLNIYFVKEHRYAPVFIVGVATISLMAGKLAGTVLSSLAASALGGEQAVLVLSSVMVLALPTTALFCLNAQNMVSGWGVFKPGHSDTDALDRAKRSIAQEASLSERETEFFELLARGWSRKRIAKELDISEETVKSHTSNIYRKLNLHSKQELIDLIDTKSQTLG